MSDFHFYQNSPLTVSIRNMYPYSIHKPKSSIFGQVITEDGHKSPFISPVKPTISLFRLT